MNESEDLTLPAGARLVHIGPAKTGTTAIQRALHDARAQLEEHGVYYPGTSARPREAGWAVVGTGVPRGRPKPTIAAWRELVDEVVAAGDQRVVVSNETFADGYTKAVRRIVDDLGGERVHVVHVVRRVDKLLSSHWQQRVQAGLHTPYDEWLRIVLGERDQQNAHWRGFWRHHDLAAVAKRWVSAAGPDNVTMVVADESDHRLLPRTFERFLALPEGLLHVEAHPANRSLTRNEIEMLRHVQQAAAEREWSDRDRRSLVRFGAVAQLGRELSQPGDERLRLPFWAAKRAAELNAERADLLRSLGVRVVGDPNRVLSEPRDDAGSGGDEFRVAPQTAALAIAATVDAARDRRRRQRIEIRRASVRATSRAVAGRQGGVSVQKPVSPSVPPVERRRVQDTTARQLVGVLWNRVLRRLGQRRTVSERGT